MYKRLLHTLSLLLLPVSYTLGQQHNYKKYSVEHGIQAQVSCMLQDSRGYIWIGTAYGGLNKFDGRSFVNYSNEKGLISNSISSLCEDKNGDLWVGTTNGLDRFDGENFYHYSTKNGLSDNEIKFIKKDSRGNLWISTGHGLAKYNGKVFTTFTEKNGLSDPKVQILFVDSKDRIWLSYRPDKGIKHVDMFDGETFHHFNVQYSEKEEMLDVRNFTEDGQGNIWMGTRSTYKEYKSLFILTDTIFKSFPHNKVLEKENKLHYLNDGVAVSFVDSKNQLWLSAFDLLFKFDLSNVSDIYAQTDTIVSSAQIYEGLGDGGITGMIEDSYQNLWIGTASGVIVYGGDMFVHYGKQEGLHGAMFKIFEDPSHRIWVNGESMNWYALEEEKKFIFIREFLKVTDKNIKPTRWYIDKKGNMWIGTMAHGLAKYDGFHSYSYGVKNGLPSYKGEPAHVIPCYDDGAGNIWNIIVTNRADIGYLNSNADKPEFHIVQLPGMEGTAALSSFFIDSRKRIWFNHEKNGLGFFEKEKITWVTKEDGLDHNKVREYIEDGDGRIWLQTWSNSGVCMYHNGEFKHFNASNGFTNETVHCWLVDSFGRIWLGTSGHGIFIYNGSDFEQITTKKGLCNGTIWNLLLDKRGNIWAGSSKGLNRIITDLKGRITEIKSYGYNEGFTGIEGNQNSAFEDSKGNLWFGTINGVTKFIPAEDKKITTGNSLNFTGLKLYFKKVDWSDFNTSSEPWTGLPKNLTLPYNQNHLTFSFVGINLRSPDKVKYKFIMEGYDKKWSPTVDKNEITYSSLPPGQYTFKVKSCNADGVWNKEPITFSFTITPPWWRTTWFYIASGLIVIFAIYSFIKWREKKLKHEKEVLELKVTERTEQLNEKTVKLEEAYKHITDSIHYAKKIQQAILPPQDILSASLRDYFIIYLPKDVVSGDYYAFYRKNDEIIIITADCTGHGVPGAFMSMIGIEQLGKIIVENGITHPDEALNSLHAGIRKALKQDVPGGESRDGMDLAFCKYNLTNNILEYAGANRPLWLVRNNEITETRPDKFPIGGLELDNRTPFTSHRIPLLKNDLIYTFTDGFADQFGGEKGKKFMLKNLERLILSVAHLPMKEQSEKLVEAFTKWKGNQEQVDDVLVIGVLI